jgi:glycosyltransferase involved in cell wall biosynthesis
MKIGLYYEHLSSWQGGRDLFWILYRGLQTGREPGDQIAVVANKSPGRLRRKIWNAGKRSLTNFVFDRSIVETLSLDPRARSIKQLMRAGDRLVLLPADELATSRRLSAFDVVGPFWSPPAIGSCRAWVGYLFDCQHKRLPEFFSDDARAGRDADFSTLLHKAPALIVNSLDAKADLTKYYSPFQTEIVALPVAAAADPGWFRLDCSSARQKYKLPDRYFLCSNQFWQHKNHGVVFDAIAKLKSYGRSVCVVFTGEMSDFRNPEYVNHLMARVRALGIEDDCRFLGLLPKLDQVAIMREAIAVIQPTLFEGGPGGGAVYDAVGLGKRVIVSDIPVNREISRYVDRYFDPHDAADLASAMVSISDTPAPACDPEQLLREGEERKRQLGVALRKAFALAIERSK